MTAAALDALEACVCISADGGAEHLDGWVQEARAVASTVLVCVEGSTEACAARAAGAVVLPVDGPGARARLLAEAHRRGFRGAVFVEADAPCPPNALATLVAALAEHPGCLVVAAPSPSSRPSFAERASDLWVWLATGQRVRGSQSALRAYPLAEVMQLGAAVPAVGDLALLVRAGWAGLPICSIDSDVEPRFRRSPPVLGMALRLTLPLPLGPVVRPVPIRPGLSLFALRRWAWLGRSGPAARTAAATLGLSAAYVGGLWPVAALAASVITGVGSLGMLAAWLAGAFAASKGWPFAWTWSGAALVAVAVGLAERHLDGRAQGQWDARSYGGCFGHWFFHQVTKRLGIGAAYVWLGPVVAYFTLRARHERAASMAYLDRAAGPAAGWARWKRSYRHFHAFAQTMLDGAVLGAHGPGVFTCVHEGLDHLRDAARSGQGAILMTAHLGNWEVASGLLEGQLGDARVALVMYRGDEARLQAYIESIRGKRPSVIAVGEGQFASLGILRALREGTVVAMQGDRTVDQRDVKVKFLGREARWPIGPWMVAAVSKVPVIFTFALNSGRLRYRFIADAPRTVAFDRRRPRDEQLREWIGEYVARIEALLAEDPLQWFNFFDFWAAEPKTPAAGRMPR